MANRVALLIATSEYKDPLLRQLRAPAQDVLALEEVLLDSGIGGFDDVTTMVDRPRHEVEEALDDCFTDRKPGDVALVYLTCHGVKDQHGRLYFATSNTRHDRLASTAISSAFVNERMERSRASAKVALLDCCYSGAFAKGLAPKSSMSGNLAGQICGKGSYVITATDSLEYAYEEDAEITEDHAVSSAFTELLVKGLKTGEADSDRDGRISPEDLFWFLDKEFQSAGRPQTPTSFSSGVQGSVYLAIAPQRNGATADDLGTDDGPEARREVNRHLRDLEVRYASIREVLASGGRRTALLDDIPAQAGSLAARALRIGLVAPRVESFTVASEGARVVTLGLLSGLESPAIPIAEAVADGIARSRSAFEQYWALIVARAHIHELPANDRQQLLDAAETALASGHVEQSSSRSSLIRALLKSER